MSVLRIPKRRIAKTDTTDPTTLPAVSRLDIRPRKFSRNPSCSKYRLYRKKNTNIPKSKNASDASKRQYSGPSSIPGPNHRIALPATDGIARA